MKAESIAAELRERIESGRIASGELLPSARAIQREWGVAIATATRVHALLRADGLAEAIPGVGTAVRASAVRSHERRGTVPDPAHVVSAAIAIADAEGLDAVTMRRLAGELGVAPMSLYRWVTDKDDLVTRMIDRIFAEWRRPAIGDGDWRDCVEAAARALWSVLCRHPWAATALSMTRPQAVPSAIDWTEWVLASLTDRGVALSDAFDLHLTLFGFIRGLALNLEAEPVAIATTGLDAEQWMQGQTAHLESLAGPARPNFARLHAEGYDYSLDRLFEVGLATLLDGIAAWGGTVPENRVGSVAPDALG